MCITSKVDFCAAGPEASSSEQQEWLPPVEFEQEKWEEVDLGKSERVPACPANSPAVVLSSSDAEALHTADAGSLKAESGLHLNSSLGLLDVSFDLFCRPAIPSANRQTLFFAGTAALLQHVPSISEPESLH